MQTDIQFHGEKDMDTGYGTSTVEYHEDKTDLPFLATLHFIGFRELSIIFQD